MKLSLILILSMIISKSSCLVAQDNLTKIDGGYNIISVEPRETGNALLECMVLDKTSNKPIRDAAVYVESLGVSCFTNESGICNFEFEEGGYIVNVINVGNTSIHTDTLALKTSTTTKVVFLLGTVSIE